MILVAGLRVVYGLFPSALFAILPTAGFEYTTYTVGHVAEGLALAAIAVVGFVFLRKPLKRVGHVPDVDRLYNPAALYGTRYLVVAITELYAGVDRAVVALSRVSTDVVKNPGDAVGDVTTGEPIQLRAGVGMSVLLVALVLVGTLALLLV